MHSRLHALGFGLAAVTASTATFAHGLRCPEHDWSFGLSAAKAWSSDIPDGAMLGVDVTYIPWCIVWVGGGLRVATGAGSDAPLPYLEAGVDLLLINLGVGYTQTWEWPPAAFGNGSGLHLFVGVPFPAFLEASWDVISDHTYVEPYYRVTYMHSDAVNELGLLVKWTTWDFD